jgi:hypothetical protein
VAIAVEFELAPDSGVVSPAQPPIEMANSVAQSIQHHRHLPVSPIDTSSPCNSAIALRRFKLGSFIQLFDIFACWTA